MPYLIVRIQLLHVRIDSADENINVGFMPCISVSCYHDRTTQLLEVDGETKSFKNGLLYS